MGFSRQEYWSGLPFPSPGDLPNPGIEPGSPTLREVALTSEPPGKTLILKEYVVISNEYDIIFEKLECSKHYLNTHDFFKIK